jgi:hypothetical protein
VIFVSTSLLFIIVVIICVILSVIMFVYILEIPNTKNLVSRLISKFSNSKIKFSAFTTMYVFRNDMHHFIIVDSCTANGHAGAFLQFIISLMPIRFFMCFYC